MDASMQKSLKAEAGDVIVIEGHHVGESRRMGEILEVVGEPGHEHYRVRWEDGRETVFYPSSDATIRQASRRRQSERAPEPTKASTF